MKFSFRYEILVGNKCFNNLIVYIANELIKRNRGSTWIMNKTFCDGDYLQLLEKKKCSLLKYVPNTISDFNNRLLFSEISCQKISIKNFTLFKYGISDFKIKQIRIF